MGNKSGSKGNTKGSNKDEIKGAGNKGETQTIKGNDVGTVKDVLGTTAANTGGATGTADGGNKEVIQGVVAQTKADKARAVFTRCYAMEQVPQRKDMIKMAMDECGLTKPGAATYLQNFKKANGLTKPAPAAAAPAAAVAQA